MNQTESWGRAKVIDVEIQNESTQTHEKVKFAVVPRIGEGVRLQDQNGFWASYDILDLWYQKAEYGDVWVPYLHVRTTPAAGGMVEGPSAAMPAVPDQSMPIADFLAKFEGEQEHETVKLNLDISEET